MPFSPLAKLAAAALVIVSAAVNAQQRDEAVLKAAERHNLQCLKA